MDEVAYSAHAVVEGFSEAAVEAGIKELKRIADSRGRDLPNSIPTIVRAHPFVPLNSILGPEGHRWAPIHGVVPLSEANRVWQAIYDLFDEFKEAREKFDITYGFLVSTMSTNAFLIEPVLFWPDERFALHEDTMEEHMLKKLPKLDVNPAAKAVVDDIKRRLCRLFLDHGAVHLQIGRAYLYREGRDQEAWRIVEALKDVVDPRHKMNPGSLGFD
jgi:FAD/FMN-containing dehydrogenase